jgi:hypothetical protein
MVIEVICKRHLENRAVKCVAVLRSVLIILFVKSSSRKFCFLRVTARRSKQSRRLIRTTIPVLGGIEGAPRRQCVVN